MPPARATVVPTPGPCKASPAARRPCQSACPGVPSCSQQPQNTARATGFSHTTRQLPGSLLPALSAPNAPAGMAAELSKRSARCVGRESNPGQLLGRQLCSPLYHQRCSARAAARPRPRARPSTLSLLPAPPPHPCPDAPSAGGSALPPAPPAAHQQAHPRQLYAAAGVHRPHRPGAALLRPCGPPAVRSPRRPASASALTPGGQRGARSYQQPAGQSPSPPCAGRGHFPRRQGDTGATRLQASRRCAAPRGLR